MMLTGCFGLLAAVGDVLPELGETIHASMLGAGGSGAPPLGNLELFSHNLKCFPLFSV